MNSSFEKIKRCKAIEIIKNILSSKFFPFATAAVLCACYFLGWDVVAMYYMGLVTILILLLLEDITPFVPHISFLNLVISLKNSPANTMDASDYYSKTAVLAQIIAIVALMFCALIYRFVLCCVKKKIKLNPVFYGLCALSFAFIINGLFSENYNPQNLLFGVVLTVCFLLFYVAIKDNIKISKENFEKIAYGFVALSALLIIELIGVYIIKFNEIFVDGSLNRYALKFGWGTYNNYGVLIVMCIPPVLYLAGKEKLGFLFTLYSVLILGASFLCFSRQAMIGALIIYPACYIILLVKGKYRIPNICIAAATIAVGIVFICIFREKFVGFFKKIFENVFVNGELNGSGRWRLWKEALNYFCAYPVLGSGFYVYYDYTGALGFFPLMCHNTILELMAACGIVGLLAYLVHRVQTAISFFKNVTMERSFIALTILPILILSLLDVHIFVIFPTLIYSALLAVLIKSQDKTPDEAVTVNEATPECENEKTEEKENDTVTEEN